LVVNYFFCCSGWSCSTFNCKDFNFWRWGIKYIFILPALLVFWNSFELGRYMPSNMFATHIICYFVWPNFWLHQLGFCHFVFTYVTHVNHKSMKLSVIFINKVYWDELKYFFNQMIKFHLKWKKNPKFPPLKMMETYMK
jgi:hypothetical protein